MARPFAAGRAFTNRTCWRSRTPTRPASIRSSPEPTISVIANIFDPVTAQGLTRDPRHVARKAEAYLQESGIADTCYIGPEPEFFIFDEVRYEQNQHSGLLRDRFGRRRVEHGAHRGAEPRIQTRLQRRLLPGLPDRHLPRSSRRDGQRDAQDRHRCRGAPSRGGHRGAVRDRHAVCAAAANGRPVHVVQVHLQERRAAHGKTVTFMPKPIFEDNGSGMHTHISLWKGGKPLFAGDGYAGLSELGLHAAGGLLKHAAASGLRGSHDQFLLPPGAGLRGACQPGDVRAESLGRRSAFRCTRRTRKRSGSSSAAPIRLQRVPGVAGDAHGDARWHSEQDRSGRAARSRHLRNVRRGAGGHKQDAGVADEALRALEEDHQFLPKGASSRRI